VLTESVSADCRVSQVVRQRVRYQLYCLLLQGDAK